MAGHTKGLTRVAVDLVLGTAPGEGRCHMAQQQLNITEANPETNRNPCPSSRSQEQNSQ